jgi:hypothetical protein
MQRQRRSAAFARPALAVAAAALALGAAALVMTPRAPALAGGTTLYGQVVEVTAKAIVVSLPSENNAWVALNLAPTTFVSSDSVSAAAPPIATNDWVLATYSVSRQTVAGDVYTWLVAQNITYSLTPISTTKQSVHVTGHVTGLTANGFTMKASNGVVWRVVVEPTTRVLLGSTPSSLSLLQSGDAVQAWGAATGHLIVATRVVYHVAAKQGSTQKPA